MLITPKLYYPLFRYFRARRAQQLVRLFRLTEKTRILDVGGSPHFWWHVPAKPRVFLLNLDPRFDVECQFPRIQADGKRLPFRDKSFDLVVSNSLIEHVGGWREQERLAEEIRRVGKAYYVQTPNRWFFLEPHTLTPFFQFLPKRVQRAMVRNLTIRGLLQRPDASQADELTYGVRLLDSSQLQILFPDGDLLPERFLGMTKSWIVVHLDGAAPSYVKHVAGICWSIHLHG